MIGNHVSAVVLHQAGTFEALNTYFPKKLVPKRVPQMFLRIKKGASHICQTVIWILMNV